MAEIQFEHVVKQFPRQVTPAVNDLSFTVNDGELLILLGPSGCGKTTALRMIAGLEEPDSGDIRIDGQSVVGMAPKDRDIALVFQQYALYPHLSARNNLLYPLKIQKISKQERQHRIDQAAELLKISHLLDRKPSQLSGGEQQRVALGRAIVRQPRVFLMDEPLSNLDAKLRTHMRTEIKTLQQELRATMAFVTHDQAEAMTMADRIAVMNGGRLQQLATPDEMYKFPANLFVAEFLGSPPMNILPVRQVDGHLTVPGGWSLPEPAQTRVPTELLLGIRPESIRVVSAGTPGAAPASVIVSEPLGSEVIVNVNLGETMVRVRTPPDVRPRPGETVHLQPDPDGVRLFDKESGAKLTS
ncbi:MAG TPA: ABC transporter ATP-binding protein [Gemmatimonadaceae bacterium]|nr:ABC transporter ATP-binding protein [Gemmatimonadaceae bacterium]